MPRPSVPWAFGPPTAFVLTGVALATFATPAAAQTAVTISMAAAPATPRINGALIVAALPGAPLQYAIAATGTPRPTFTATGLPAGLMLNATTGRLSGSVTAAGRTTAMITATNSAGSDTEALIIAVGDTLALTPPMGWNSYDSFDDSVKESEFVPQATWVRDNLQPYGWDTVVVDFRWYDPGAPGSDQGGSNPNLVVDASGRFLPDPVRFPSAANGVGFKALAQQVHDMGLRFGIHIMRGMPRKTYTANTPIAGSTYTAQQAGDTAKVCRWNADNYGVKGATAAGQAWYDSLFSLYAGWGVDFVKVDDITSNPGATDYWADEVEAIHAAIAKSGRSIVLSLSPGETPVAQANHLTTYANMWRQSDDFWDRPADLNNSFTLAQRWTVVTGPPGHWPDADMLPLGRLGPRCPVNGANRTTGFTHNEQVMMLSLWAIMPSPLMLGANLVTSNDAFMTALLTNEEVLAVDQDVLGARGERVALSGNTEVWSKDLSGGRKAVGVFNRDATDATVAVRYAQFGISGTQVVRDLWRRMDLATSTAGFSVSVPGRAGLLFTVSPAPTGAGGAGGGAVGGATGAGGGTATGGRGGGAGGGGAPSTGGRGGNAGAVATGGVGTGGGMTASGGAGVGTGGDAGSGTGGSGSVATGGAPMPSGGATASGGVTGGGSGGQTGTGGLHGPATVTPSSGCACTTIGDDFGGPSRTNRTFTLTFLGVGVLLARRRRRR